MRPTSDYIEVDTVAGLVSATGQVVIVRPYGTLYGFVPAVVRCIPEIGQWVLGYLDHSQKRIVKARLFVNAVDILNELCIMRKP